MNGQYLRSQSSEVHTERGSKLLSPVSSSSVVQLNSTRVLHLAGAPLPAAGQQVALGFNLLCLLPPVTGTKVGDVHLPHTDVSGEAAAAFHRLRPPLAGASAHCPRLIYEN